MSILSKIAYYGASAVLNRVFSLFPMKENRVLFISDVRSDISGNFKCVYDSLDPHWQKVTSLKGDRRLKRTFGQWLAQCWYIATSKYVLLDDYTTSTAYIRVRKGQELVQLWHSSGAYKKFAHSRTGEGGDIRHIHQGYKRYTKTICSSDFCRPCFSEAFSIPMDRVLATGIPRTDIFFDKDYIARKQEEFYEKYPELKEKKIILFAPTYRGTKVEEATYDFSRFDLDQAYRTLGDDYAIIFKWHPALYNNIRFGIEKAYDLDKYPGFAYDLSPMREINDLLFITDILITDYSSLIFDYALVNKPIIFFAYDLEDYEDGRGMYFPFSAYIYGRVCRDTDQLLDAIQAEDMGSDRRSEFIHKFIDKNDGHATQRVMEAVFGGANDHLRSNSGGGSRKPDAVRHNS
ncbi:MAG: CDP-glycerol glycerophosphotransferase family protein [Eubacterium sp.]|jgi:CDP-ribitol ribitolphosphotransferase|nr:CDP-glycerol glycerophosphotransferase family protein [Eubacterium sp.]MCH4046980.1 CDP-glycerol glycerophosphotransferase family protein [Eubacterium sp.]MCH4080077.1 CDP-glycerol glycerophosphotransferase family protein [Eubacterium sp.]MCH4109881.1 CDP-glycerol glycerophosphotransferase family protein [Eubacterium sp.]MCI1308071.1 CDP-glycerol glycerophosphotransferase family protein [Eubacterium sp.]